VILDLKGGSGRAMHWRKDEHGNSGGRRMNMLSGGGGEKTIYYK